MNRLTKCCCCSVRTGALVIGSLTLVLTAFAVAAYSTVLGMDYPQAVTNSIRRRLSYGYSHEQITETDYRFKMELMDKIDVGVECVIGIVIAYAVVKLIFSCLLLAGISKNKHQLALPWLIASCFEYVINCKITVAYPIICFVMQRYADGAIFLLLSVPFNVLCFYLIRVVHSEYKNIKDAKKSSNIGIVDDVTLPYKIME